jgi:predicted ATPase
LYTVLAEVYAHTGHMEDGLHALAKAEAWLQRAVAVARCREAKALELRAAMSLAHLWQQQGRWDEVRTLLAPIYGWFTEGFDTTDLQEARTLLEELGGYH